MFKDYDKYLSTSLKVYILVLVIVFIMKIVGLDYFGIDINNQKVIQIEQILERYKLTEISYFIVLMIYQYLMVSIIVKDNSKKLKIFTILTIPSTAILQHIKSIYVNSPLMFICEMGYIFAICKIYNKEAKAKDIIKKLLIILFLQFISYITRGKMDTLYESNYVSNLLLNLDYFIMLLIYQNIELKGGISCRDTVGSFSQKLTNLKRLPKQLQRNWRKFKQQDKVDKITFIIYFALTLLWNIFTFVIVLLVAMLNDTLIECIFIITSFWLSKRAFGKAFHLKSMIQCFIVSNITYYILNRITTPLGISILIPIMLGVGLSYVTSKLVKKTYKPLYRGMTKEMFEETILQIVDKDSLKYKICYDFYINKKSDLSLSMKYNYSVVGIRKIKSRINDKIKEL